MKNEEHKISLKAPIFGPLCVLISILKIHCKVNFICWMLNLWQLRKILPTNKNSQFQPLQLGIKSKQEFPKGKHPFSQTKNIFEKKASYSKTLFVQNNIKFLLQHSKFNNSFLDKSTMTCCGLKKILSLNWVHSTILSSSWTINRRLLKCWRQNSSWL